LETARVGGVDLAYVDKGKGDPVIFVHGGMTDLRSWLGTQIEPFSKGPPAITATELVALSSVITEERSRANSGWSVPGALIKRWGEAFQ